MVSHTIISSMNNLFMSSFILLGAIFQWPVGWLSDRMDRRVTIAATSMVVMILCGAIVMVNPSASGLIQLFGVLGGVSLGIYPLAIASINDRLQPEKMVEASSTMVLIYGTGSILGPSSIGLILDHLGHDGFFIHIGLMHFIIASISAFFIFKRPPVPQQQQTLYQNVPPKATMVAMEAVALEAEESQAEDAAG